DGTAKTQGATVGQAAAAELVALRANDGRFASVPAPPDGDEPGEWRRTSPGPAVTPWVAHVTPFVVSSPDQFRPEGPNALSSADYAAQWDEVRRFGARTGSERTEAQTEIARFWTENTVGQFNRALRGLAVDRGLSEGQTARLFAMTALTGADGMITCWNSKFHHLFWRPVTAIRLADTDGNPATTADPTWEPLSTTANHPEYTSGHACLTGAVSRALAEFLGTANIDLTMDAAVAGTVRHHFPTVAELRLEVENARIYGGDHFRVGGADGTRAGDHVARFGLKRNFLPA
ncbi:MAG: vanadium-dependent haloperoxidase, partial [Acidimicrobiales bacterium]